MEVASSFLSFSLATPSLPYHWLVDIGKFTLTFGAVSLARTIDLCNEYGCYSHLHPGAPGLDSRRVWAYPIVSDCIDGYSPNAWLFWLGVLVCGDSGFRSLMYTLDLYQQYY